LTVIHPEDRELVSASLERQLRGDQTNDEFRIVRLSDGALRWVWVQAFPVKNDAGHVYRVAGIAEDITERKETEKLLTAKERHWRLVTDALPSLIYYVNRDHRYVSHNRAYETWFGPDFQHVTGLHLQDVLGRAAYETLRPQLDAAFNGGHVSFESSVPYQQVASAIFLSNTSQIGTNAGTLEV
jgi:PAS domain-containing protein